MNEWTVTYFTIVYSLPAIIGMCYVSSSLNFCKDCLEIILEKLHGLYSYLPVYEKMCKKLEPPEDDSVSLHYKLVALSNVS